MNFKSSQLKQNLKLVPRLAFVFILLQSTYDSVYGQVLIENECNKANTQIFSVSSGVVLNNWLNPTNWTNPEDPDNKVGINETPVSGLREEILQYSLNFLGIRYRSSGKSPRLGFDCSGFTGYIFRNFGFRLKSSSTAQAMEGKKVPVSEAKVGDLAFFGKKGRRGKVMVNHAAIVISKPGEPLEIIHSASNKGIVVTKVEESRYWSHALLFVRNVL